MGKMPNFDIDERIGTILFSTFFQKTERCFRVKDGTEWWCINDHTGCLWNDGNNTCMNEDEGEEPLEN
jgi:hypothetical protein